MIRFAAITPHPPIIVPSIGRSNLNLARRTVTAMKTVAEKFRAVKADTVVVVSPHGPVQFDKFMINYSPNLVGDLSQFGDQRRFVFSNDREMVDDIVSAERKASLPVGLARELDLDHGALVPLHYLLNEKDLSYNPKLIHLSFTMLPYSYHYKFGEILGQILLNSPKIISFIASGDLSHRVTPEAPAGYSPEGLTFDKNLVNLIKTRNVEGILNLDPRLAEEAGECGLRSIIMLMGALSTVRWEVKSLSYEAPFGVGYMVANLHIR